MSKISYEELEAELDRLKIEMPVKPRLCAFLKNNDECTLTNEELANVLKCCPTSVRSSLRALRVEGAITMQYKERVIRPVRTEE